MDWKHDSMSSKKHSESPTRIEWHVPTTDADIRALRTTREKLRPWPLERLNELAPTGMFPVTPRRSVFAGGESFRL